MFDTRIAHISYYIPENSVPVADVVNRVNEKDIPTAFANKEAYISFIQNELGVSTLRKEDLLNDKQMLANTVEQIFTEGIVEPDDIDLIVLAQEEDQRQQANLGQFIQYEFDLNNAYVLNVSGNHCANIDYALTLASQMAQGNNSINNILILGNVKINNPLDRLVSTYGVISDGSGTMLLKKDVDGWGLKNSRIISAGRFHEVNLNRDDSLILCKYYVKTLKELIQKAGILPEQVSHIITQNANPLLINQCIEMVGLDVAKIYTANQTKYAHLDCLDFLVNLKDLTAELKGGKNEGYILSFGTGWAGSYIASLLSYN
jgi:3-oxoacyl-[acyl-carrier-protein] synthase III